MKRMSRLNLLLTASALASLSAVTRATEPAPTSVAESVVGTTLVLRLPDGRQLTGGGLTGQTFALGGLTLRIGAIEKDTASGATLHSLEYKASGESWRPVCEPDARGRRLALFLPGLTGEDGYFVPREDVVSVTCTSGAEGKCLLAGYFPAQARGLDRFEACKRMIRADYCGDGIGWTRDGTVIDIYDFDGIQSQSSDDGMALEAAWGRTGAVCVHHTRVPERLTLDALKRMCPRLSHLVGERCTEDQMRNRPDVRIFNRSIDVSVSR